MSAFIVAIDLGRISPKIITSMVIMPVAAPVIRLVAFEKPDFFARFMAKVVAREDAERLTMLFPSINKINSFEASLESK